MSDETTHHPGAWAEKDPERIAIQMSGGRTVTYRELDETANRLSRVFRSAGLQPGDHIAFCMENRAEFLPIMWGAHYAGLYYTAISSRLTADELGYIIEDSGSRAFLTSPYKADQVAEIEGRLSKVGLRLAVGGEVSGFDSFEEAIASESPAALEGRTDGSPMLYSSGTTGRPKGVKAPLSNTPVGTPEGLTNLITLLFGADADSVYLSPAPLYHSAPLRYCTQFHRIGATVAVMERFDAEEALAMIERHKVTHSQWVPTMFVRMLKLPEETRARYDLSLIHI